MNGHRFAGALLEAELRPVGDAVDQEAAVGGVDHVGQALDGVDELDLVAERDVRVVQVLPLAQRHVGVGRVGRHHPRVDRVADREVLGTAHQVAAAVRRCAGSGPELVEGSLTASAAGAVLLRGHCAPQEGAADAVQGPGGPLRRFLSLSMGAQEPRREGCDTGTPASILARRTPRPLNRRERRSTRGDDDLADRVSRVDVRERVARLGERERALDHGAEAPVGGERGEFAGHLGLRGRGERADTASWGEREQDAAQDAADRSAEPRRPRPRRARACPAAGRSRRSGRSGAVPAMSRTTSKDASRAGPRHPSRGSRTCAPRRARRRAPRCGRRTAPRPRPRGEPRAARRSGRRRRMRRSRARGRLRRPAPIRAPATPCRRPAAAPPPRPAPALGAADQQRGGADDVLGERSSGQLAHHLVADGERGDVRTERRRRCRRRPCPGSRSAGGAVRTRVG